MSKDLFAQYGVTDKTPMELIEEFATEMLIGHGIQVTEINFSERGLDKVTCSVQPKERIVFGNQEELKDAKISRMYSSAGRIKLGTAEEVKE